VQSYTAVHSEVAPLWWKNLDFIFITISFFAINQSTKNSSKKSIQYALWGFWVTLLFLIINEKMEWFHLGELVTYAVALTLAILHLYNLNYCQCENEDCCPQDLKN
jgi:multidrug transporter EmrE-like cation transporter